METVYRLVITGIVIQWKSYVVAHGQLLDTVISIEMVQTSLNVKRPKLDLTLIM